MSAASQHPAKPLAAPYDNICYVAWKTQPDEDADAAIAGTFLDVLRDLAEKPKTLSPDSDEQRMIAWGG